MLLMLLMLKKVHVTEKKFLRLVAVALLQNPFKPSGVESPVLMHYYGMAVWRSLLD